MSLSYSSDSLPTTSYAALRQFEDRYIAVNGVQLPPSWADALGDTIPTNAPVTTFPIASLATKYQESKTSESRAEGRPKEASFDVKQTEYEEGYEASLIDLYYSIFAWRKWQSIPTRFVVAEQRFRNKMIATLLEAGASTSIWDGVNFFSTTHPANYSDSSKGTWSNYQATPADVSDLAKIEAEVTAMRAVKDENGDKLDVNPDTILLPVEKFEAVKNRLAQNFVLDSTGAAAVSNPYMGRFKLIAVPEFTDVNDWYLIDSSLLSRGLSPWAILKQNVPPALALRQWDETSDFFKKSGKIKVSSHIWYGSALVMPHGIRKVVGA